MKQLLKRKGAGKMLIVMAFLTLLAFVLVFALNVTVCLRARSHVLDLDDAANMAEDFDCILVLGAGVKKDGEPSHMLEDRLKVGIQLYEMGASERLLMSGDHMREDYDEVGTMKRYAAERGVPSNVIFLDHAGLSTYESMWRAKEIFGAERILIVTQKYHLYRAIYTAEALGMEAYGVPSDLRSYRKILLYEAREVAARVKAFLNARTNPTPPNIGEKVDLSGDGDTTNVNKLFS